MKRFKNILYVTKFGMALKAFHQAVDLAERNNAFLTVVLVMERIPPYLTLLKPDVLQRARIKELSVALDKLSELVKGRVKIETKIVEGEFFLEVVREVVRNGRDLVVKATDGDTGFAGGLFGTTDRHILRKCPCPVWLIKSTEPTPIQRVMACVDLSDSTEPGLDASESLNRTILELAASVATTNQTELHLVHVWDVPAEDTLRSARTGFSEEEADEFVEEIHQYHEDWLAGLMNQTKNWIGEEVFNSITVKLHLPKGAARDLILTLSQELNIDLVVMGTVARTGIPGFFIGNTAESVLGQINCSVLAVKPAGFITPVTLGE